MVIPTTPEFINFTDRNICTQNQLHGSEFIVQLFCNMRKLTTDNENWQKKIRVTLMQNDRMMWISPACANLRRNFTVLLTSYMIVFRFCWPELCLFFPLSLRCCLRSVSNWNTWGKKCFKSFEIILPKNIAAGKHRWILSTKIKKKKCCFFADYTSNLKWKILWQQKGE